MMAESNLVRESWHLSIPHDRDLDFSAAMADLHADARTTPVGLTWRATRVRLHRRRKFHAPLPLRQRTDVGLDLRNIAEAGCAAPKFTALLLKNCVRGSLGGTLGAVVKGR